MRNDSDQNGTEPLEQSPAGGLARIGGALIVLGTGLSMVLEGWQADAAMGAALLGLILALAGRAKPLT